jgi:hypothetical protein
MTPFPSTPVRGITGCLLLAACLLGGAAPAPAGGQTAPAADLWVGSELERYFRVMQVAGEVPLHAWSVRGFSPDEADALMPRGAHPWSGRYAAGEGAGVSITAVPLEVSARYNTAFPYGFNDAAVWAGRGLTLSAGAGVGLRAGPLSVRAAPTGFRAENRDFELMPTGRDGPLAYAYPYASGIPIDQPQRFGDRPYARLDAGQSHVRLDAAGLALGLSTENQAWGPALHQPLLLGHNAPGFAHAFAGTSAPLAVGIGRLQARLVWGRLEQSEYAAPLAGYDVRFMTGAAATFSPRPIPGLEVGLARFFHLPWPEDGLTSGHLWKLFEGVTKVARVEEEYDEALDNQLASVFFRWVLPSAGFEVYGEYGREDHNWDLQDFVMEPDHQAGFLVGAQKVWARADRRAVVLRGELLNTQPSQLIQGRHQARFYGHSGLRQGHTHRGQVLGAPFGRGGGGGVVGVDAYGPGGRWSVEWVRGRIADDWRYWRTGTPASHLTEAVHVLNVDGVAFRGPLDFTWGAAAVYNLNRHFADDAFNLNARLGVRLHW